MRSVFYNLVFSPGRSQSRPAARFGCHINSKIRIESHNNILTNQNLNGTTPSRTNTAITTWVRCRWMNNSREHY